MYLCIYVFMYLCIYVFMYLCIYVLVKALKICNAFEYISGQNIDLDFEIFITFCFLYTVYRWFHRQ